MKKIILLTMLIIPLILNAASPVLLDNYDGLGNLTYNTESSGTSYWEITGGEYVSKTGGVTTPEHSFASYDLSNRYSNWTLSKSKELCWCGWMDLNRDIVSGWGGASYSCGFVLAANSDDLNTNGIQGYAVGFRNSPDGLVIFKFSNGIQDGTIDLPNGATEIVSSGYTYANSDNGVNFYVEYLSDGKWKIYYKAGTQLSDSDAIDKTKYDGGNATSTSADETYTGSTYKHAGWIYAHSSSGSEKAYFDNFGAGGDATLPVTLSNFTAQYLNSKPTLYWQTQSEEDNMGWFIYRNTVEDFTSAEKITGMIEGHGTTTQPQSYIYEDAEELQVEQTYYYWLESVDYSGTIHHYDRVTQVTIPHPNDPGQNVTPPVAYDITADPNPFSQTTEITFALNQTSRVDVSIYNIKGELVKSFGTVMTNVDEEVSFHWNGKDNTGKSLSNGVYLYSVIVNGKDYATKQLILMK